MNVRCLWKAPKSLQKIAKNNLKKTIGTITTPCSSLTMKLTFLKTIHERMRQAASDVITVVSCRLMLQFPADLNFHFVDRTFINSSNVRRHERRAHNIKNITKPHLKCEKCSYQTYQQTNMTFHMQKHSTGAKKCDEIKSPLECGYCQKGFLTPSNRVRHEKTVHGSSERLYPCNLCFKSFITEVKLIKHVENHHATATDVVESDDKPESSSNAKLLCDHCPYQTNCRITLTRHMVSHLKGTKPQTGNISRLQCRFCTKAFNHLSNRKRHEVEKHLLKTSRSKISASLRNSSTKSSAKSGIIKKKNENIN